MGAVMVLLLMMVDDELMMMRIGDDGGGFFFVFFLTLALIRTRSCFCSASFSNPHLRGSLPGL